MKSQEYGEKGLHALRLSWLSGPRNPTAILRSISLLLILILGAHRDASAQHPPLDPGARLRISAEGMGIHEYIGAFSRINSDTIQVGDMLFPIDRVSRVEISRGQQTELAKGLGVGFFVGGLAGGGIGAAFCWPCDREYEILGPIAGATAGALLGLLVGGQRGYSIERESWEEIPRERLRFSLVPQSRHRLALLASYRTGFGTRLRR